MIECEKCSRWTHADEISLCPECGIEICMRCFEKHIKKCGFNDHIDDD